MCMPCAAALHYECSVSPCCCNKSGPVIVKLPVAKSLPEARTEGYKDASLLKDPQSTGRKAAAVEYKITPGMLCEWAGLRSAGGGQFPIVGCGGNPAKHRHHGPDKNTLNNAPGNVHRICHFCHNRWHARNDPGYNSRLDPDKRPEPFHEHDAETKATPEQIILAASEWKR